MLCQFLKYLFRPRPNPLEAASSALTVRPPQEEWRVEAGRALYCDFEEALLSYRSGQIDDRVSILFAYLVLEGNASRGKAVAATKAIVQGAACKTLILLDTLCRKKSFLGWTSDWRNVDPEWFIPAGVDGAERACILGLASLHPNGWLREKAVRQLADSGRSQAIPFLFLRINDWVHQVREAARIGLEPYLASRFSESLAFHLPLLSRLERDGRTRPVELIARIRTVLGSDHQALAACFGLDNRKARILCLEIAAADPEFPLHPLLHHFHAESDPEVRKRMVRTLSAHRPPDQLATVPLGTWLSDRSSQVRSIGLEMHARAFPERAGSFLQGHLVSPSAECRRVARKFLGLGSEVQDYCRRSLGTATTPNVGALLALGEIGIRDDAARLRAFLASPSPSAVRAALKGFKRLDAEAFLDVGVPFLLDPRPGVSKEARIQAEDLAPRIPGLYLGKVLRQSDHPHSARNAWYLIRRMHPWDSFGILMEAAADPPQGINEDEVRIALADWLKSLNSYFIAPEQRIRRFLWETWEKWNSSLPERLRGELEFALRGRVQ